MSFHRLYVEETGSNDVRLYLDGVPVKGVQSFTWSATHGEHMTLTLQLLVNPGGPEDIPAWLQETALEHFRAIKEATE